MHHPKQVAGIFSLLMIMAVCSPVVQNWRAEPHDGFPLSYYPMFSHKRTAEYSINYFVGLDAAGGRHYITYELIGSGGFNQVRRQVNKMIRQKKGDELLGKVAQRVIKSKKYPYRQLDSVLLVKGVFHFETYFEQGRKAPIKEKIICGINIERP